MVFSRMSDGLSKKKPQYIKLLFWNDLCLPSDIHEQGGCDYENDSRSARNGCGSDGRAATKGKKANKECETANDYLSLHA
jgi:hypothetical protein